MQDEKYADLVWDHDEVAHKKFIENLAPIVLFTYNRLDHTKKTIEALQKNIYAQESELYIYSDAPKNEDAKKSVEAVHAFLHQVDGFKQIHIIEREKNWGLAENIIDGVTGIINKYGKIIVLEDDIVTSKYFLKYMNDALEVYKEQEKVMAISGFLGVPDKAAKLPETFFLPWFICWGWATWRRCWKYFERDPEKLIKMEPIQDIHRFNMMGEYDFWRDVERNYSGELYTWAIFFYVTIFLHEGLVLYAHYNQCINIGLDGTGEHCGKSNMFGEERLSDIKIQRYTNEISSDLAAEKLTVNYYHNLNTQRNVLQKIIAVCQQSGLKGLLGKIKERIKLI